MWKLHLKRTAMDVEFGGAKREIMRGNRDRERQKKKKGHGRSILNAQLW